EQQAEVEAKVESESAAMAATEPEADDAQESEEEPEPPPTQHVPGELDIPDGVAVLEGSPSGADRTVGIVVSRFNGEISNRLLESALEALAAAGVAGEGMTGWPVAGGVEVPVVAMGARERPRRA